VQSNVKLKIYNSLGELVKYAVNGNLKPGSYNIEFNATELASGVYYYIMEYIEEVSGMQNSISKKMVLVK
jgi:hypothetical protein